MKCGYWSFRKLKEIFGSISLLECCSGQWLLSFTLSALIRNDVSHNSRGLSGCSGAGHCGRMLQWDRKPERKLLISFLQREGIIVMTCMLVSYSSGSEERYPLLPHTFLLEGN